jgi:hypothetical protein
VTIFQETGDRHSEGQTTDTLAMAFRGLGSFEEAVAAHQGALAIFEETRHPQGQRMALTNLLRTPVGEETRIAQLGATNDDFTPAGLQHKESDLQAPHRLKLSVAGAGQKVLVCMLPLPALDRANRDADRALVAPAWQHQEGLAGTDLNAGRIGSVPSGPGAAELRTGIR